MPESKVKKLLKKHYFFLKITPYSLKFVDLSQIEQVIAFLTDSVEKMEINVGKSSAAHQKAFLFKNFLIMHF